MESYSQSTYSIPHFLGLPAESNAFLILEGLFAIALPLGVSAVICLQKSRKRRTLKRQIEMLERVWRNSSKKVQ